MPRDKSFVNHLAEVSLFSALSKKELGLVARRAEDVSVAAGKVLISEGTTGHEFFVVLAGTAKVTRRGRRVATLGPGDAFGELALLDRSPRNATHRGAPDGAGGARPARVRGPDRRRPGFSRKLLAGMPGGCAQPTPAPSYRPGGAPAGPRVAPTRSSSTARSSARSAAVPDLVGLPPSSDRRHAIAARGDDHPTHRVPTGSPCRHSGPATPAWTARSRAEQDGHAAAIVRAASSETTGPARRRAVRIDLPPVGHQAARNHALAPSHRASRAQTLRPSPTRRRRGSNRGRRGDGRRAPRAWRDRQGAVGFRTSPPYPHRDASHRAVPPRTRGTRPNRSARTRGLGFAEPTVAADVSKGQQGTPLRRGAVRRRLPKPHQIVIAAGSWWPSAPPRSGILRSSPAGTTLAHEAGGVRRIPRRSPWRLRADALRLFAVAWLAAMRVRKYERGRPDDGAPPAERPPPDARLPVGRWMQTLRATRRRPHALVPLLRVSASSPPRSSSSSTTNSPTA